MNSTKVVNFWPCSGASYRSRCSSTGAKLCTSKSRRRLAPRAVLALVLVVLPAAADAPRSPPQYQRFDSDDTTIRDEFTKLEWDRRQILRNVEWAVAKGGCGLAPFSGRLPTVKELLTILDEEPHNEYEFGRIVPKMIDALAFDQTPVDLPYWTSTPAGPGVAYWTVNFSTGLMQARGAAPEKAHARCVR